MRVRLGLVFVLAFAGLMAVAPGSAEARGKGKPKDQRLALITANGRPTVKVDRLEVPADVAGIAYYKHYLANRLKREGRRARWGAGRNNVIQYRFKVTELSIVAEGDVLRVRCAAVGRLPGGQAAKSRLSFGGDPSKRRQVVEHVLDIVARGVVTRLAELERIRRGDLVHARVHAPTNTGTQ